MDWIVGSRSSSVAPAPQGKDANPGKMLPGRTPSDSLHSVPTGSRHGPQRAGVDEATRMRSVAWLKAQSFRNKEADQTAKEDAEQDPEVRAAITVQRFVRKRYYDSLRLHCKHLSQRLRYENDIVRGVFRLVNQATILALMLVALSLSSNSNMRLGIRTNLRSSFELDDLVTVTRRDDFEERLKQISARSKDYFPLSSRRFTSYEAGDKQLIGNIRKFNAPILLSNVDVAVLSSFSLTVWVRTSPQFLQGYIIRKGTGLLGEGDDVSCWGLHLDGQRGPALHYGSHDDLNGRYIGIGLEQPKAFASNAYTLLTMVVHRGMHVDFYQNLQHLGRRALPRPVTDCFNDGKGLFVGDGNLELGQLRTYVSALSNSSIQEIFELGGTLEDISTGSEPSVVEKSQLDLLQSDVIEAATKSRSELSAAQDANALNSVIQQVIAEQRVGQASHRSPVMAVGNTPSESYDAGTDAQISAQDAVIAREFYQILTGPSRLAATTNADARYLTNLPSFKGTGATLTWWYRHIDCASSNCGVYLMHAFDESGIPEHSYCWTIWLENNAIWWDNLKGTPKYQYPKYDDEGMAAKYKYSGDKIWRHLAFQWDETDDRVRFFIDGTLAIDKPWGSSVSNADCAGPGKRIAFGHSHPGYTYGATVEVFDFRMYVHNLDSTAAPLSPANLRSIASAPTPALASQFKCKKITEILDTTWTDEFGHPCQWYFKKRDSHPIVCKSAAAAAQCPLACLSVQECFMKEETVPSFQVWDRVRRLEPMDNSPNGTLCLGSSMVAGASSTSSLSRAKVVQQCEAWQQRGGLASEVPRVVENWLESMTVGREGRRLNVTEPCTLVAAAIDEHCSFDIAQVEEFTRLVKKNGGDMTLAFWVKPIHELSLIGSRFFPQITFFSRLHPPQHVINQGIWFNPNGEFRVGSACRPITSRWPFENIEMKRASETDWTFFAISLKNMSQEEGGKTRTTIFTNLGTNWELADFPICHFDEKALFTSIEVNYPMLISPITMIPVALPNAKVQELFYDAVNDMPIRIGPRVQQRDRVKEVVPLTKLDYMPKSALVGAPLIFQERKEAAESGCAVRYSIEWASEQERKAVEERCSSPYVCKMKAGSNSSNASVDAAIACPGESEWDKSHFGLFPASFFGQNGFVDFLYSLTDNSFLYRRTGESTAFQGSLMKTADFVDTMTSAVRVILVFYTPESGITTTCIINADFHGAQSAEITYELLHFEIIEGSTLTMYTVVQSLVVFNLLAMLLEAIGSFTSFHKELRVGIPLSIRSLFIPMVDIFAAVLVLVYVCLRLPAKLASAEKATKILSGLDQIEWGSPDIALAKKKATFLTLVDELLALCFRESAIDILCNVILLINLFRVIQCTSMHPRLNLLMGTLKHALNDLWHAAILVAILMSFFAGIGNWRFGDSRQDFSSFSNALATEFMMTFGEFPDGWDSTWELQAIRGRCCKRCEWFAVLCKLTIKTTLLRGVSLLGRVWQLFITLYFFVIFVFVFNFLLAIIVEAYMDLREETAGKQVSRDFVQDLFLVAYTSRVRMKYCWPNPDGLGMILELWDARLSVGYSDLLGTGLFGKRKPLSFFQTPTPPSESVLTFLNYYKRYDFLQPPEVGKYGVKGASGPGGKKVQPTVQDGGPSERRTLASEMDKAFAVVQERRALKDQGMHGAGKEIMKNLKARKVLDSFNRSSTSKDEERSPDAVKHGNGVGSGGGRSATSNLEDLLEELEEPSLGDLAV